MGIHLDVEDLNTLFYTTGTKATIINTIPVTTQEEKDRFNNQLYTTINADLLTNKPRCRCGEISGVYHLHLYCSSCGSVVEYPRDTLDPLLWIKAPNGVQSLFHPHIWIMLGDEFSISGFNAIEWIADPTYESSSNQDFAYVLESAGLKRGWNYFVKNFDKIIDTLYGLVKFKKKQSKRNGMSEFLKKYRALLFTKYLPLPNKAFIIVDESSSDTYVSQAMIPLINAARTMVGIDREVAHVSQYQKELKTVKCIKLLAEYYLDFYKNVVSSKEGLARRNLYACRSHFACRNVISSRTDPHNAKCIKLPWKSAVSMLAFHIMSKLYVRGYSYKEAKNIISVSSNIYSPLVADIMKELIAETDNTYLHGETVKGIPVVICRNPTLAVGSIMLVYVDSINEDLTDQTIHLPILITKQMNADFDGDQISVYMPLDREVTLALCDLGPQHSMFSPKDYETIDGCNSLPKSITSMWGRGISAADEKMRL